VKNNYVAKHANKINRASVHADRRRVQRLDNKQAVSEALQEVEDCSGTSTPPSPKKPTKAYIDGDMILFSAASAGEQVMYIYKDKDGKEVCRFDSADKGKKWIEEFEIFGVDAHYGYKGEAEDLTRETQYVIGDFDTCKKTFKTLLKRWVVPINKWAGKDIEVVCYISKATGAENFRYQVATIKPYKGGRANTRKPHYLEELRKWASKLPEVKMARGRVEVDDVTCALAQRAGEKGVVVSGDKDANGVSGCWVFDPERDTIPRFSDPTSVGEIYLDESGGMKGIGWLFWLGQCLKGDNVDNIGGCKGVGDAKAVKVLEQFSGADISMLERAVQPVCQVYMDTYGDEHKYKNHHTGKMVTVSWRDILIENLRLVYMLKKQDDSPDEVIDYINNYANF
jgi:hypothetical protein